MPILGAKMTTTLGDKLRRHRQEKGYSLDKLAEITESSKSYLWNWRTGTPESRPPRS